MELVEVHLRSLAELPRECIRGAILDMQAALLQSPEATTDLSYFPVRHVFAPGTYAREMTIPEGQVIFGMIHRHAHLNIISAGRCTVLTEFGIEHLEAPCTFVSLPGTKRVVFAVDNVVWTTVYATDSTDVDAIVKEFTTDTYSDIELVGDFTRITP